MTTPIFNMAQNNHMADTDISFSASTVTPGSHLNSVLINTQHNHAAITASDLESMRVGLGEYPYIPFQTQDSFFSTYEGRQGSYRPYPTITTTGNIEIRPVSGFEVSGTNLDKRTTRVNLIDENGKYLTYYYTDYKGRDDITVVIKMRSDSFVDEGLKHAEIVKKDDKFQLELF